MPGTPTPPLEYDPPRYDPPIQVVDLSQYEIPRLGCGEYEVLITQKAAGTTLCAASVLFPTSITFGRRLNEISEASVFLSLKGNDAACCDCLSEVRPWRHELRINRDGISVWVGPIVGLVMDPNTNIVKIMARDLMAWFDKRVFRQSADYEVEDIPLSDVFEDLVQHGYSRDPWSMTLRLSAVPVPTSKFYPGYDTEVWGGRYPVIGDELRTLVDAGMDYTMINRDLYAGVVEQSFSEHYVAVNGVPPTRTVLIDQTWAELPKIEVVGTYMSNYTIVGGGFTGYYGWDVDQMWIEDAGISGAGTDGLLETVHINSSTEDVFTDEHPNAITAEAYGRNRFNRNPHVKLSSGQLSPDAPFGFDLLIPGLIVYLGISSGCVGLDTQYRIHSVSTELSADSESVSVELGPVGAEWLVG